MTWFRTRLYLHVRNRNFADKMLLLYVHSWGQVFHGAWGVSMIHTAVNGAIRSGATGFCWEELHDLYCAHTPVRNSGRAGHGRYSKLSIT